MVIRYVAAILIISAAGLYSAELRAGRSAAAGTPDFGQLPQELNGWWGQDFPTSEGVARVLAADATLHRRYRRADGAEIWLFLAYFAQQQVNSQIHSPRNCLPAGGWTVTRLKNETLALGDRAQPAMHMRIQSQGRAQDVVYWFRTPRGTLAGEYALKWDLVRSALARRPTNAAFVRYNAAAVDSLALRELMSRLGAPLDAALSSVGL